MGQATLSPALSLEIRQLTMIQTDHSDPWSQRSLACHSLSEGSETITLVKSAGKYRQVDEKLFAVFHGNGRTWQQEEILSDELIEQRIGPPETNRAIER